MHQILPLGLVQDIGQQAAQPCATLVIGALALHFMGLLQCFLLLTLVAHQPSYEHTSQRHQRNKQQQQHQQAGQLRTHAK